MEGLTMNTGTSIQYRGYTIMQGIVELYITKDGYYISAADSVEGAKEIIDTLIHATSPR